MGHFFDYFFNISLFFIKMKNFMIDYGQCVFSLLPQKRKLPLKNKRGGDPFLKNKWPILHHLGGVKWVTYPVWKQRRSFRGDFLFCSSRGNTHCPWPSIKLFILSKYYEIFKNYSKNYCKEFELFYIEIRKKNPNSIRIVQSFIELFYLILTIEIVSKKVF